MDAETGWEAATWEGSRRARIRRALRLTVRERLEGLEALAEVSARLAQSAPPAEAGTRPHADEETPPASTASHSS